MKNIKVNITATGLLAGTAIVGGVIVAYKVYRGGTNVIESVKDTVSNDLNPASPNNVIYDSISDWVFNGQNSLGGWLYDVTHPNYREQLTNPTAN